MSANRLPRIAEYCMNGACNVRALIQALAEATAREPMSCCLPDNHDLKIIIGHISYLIGESAGPTPEAVDNYLQEREDARSGKDATITT